MTRLDAYDPCKMVGLSESSSGIGETEDLRLVENLAAFDGASRLWCCLWAEFISAGAGWAGRAKSGIEGMDTKDEAVDCLSDSSVVIGTRGAGLAARSGP